MIHAYIEYSRYAGISMMRLTVTELNLSSRISLYYIIINTTNYVHVKYYNYAHKLHVVGVHLSNIRVD